MGGRTGPRARQYDDPRVSEGDRANTYAHVLNRLMEEKFFSFSPVDRAQTFHGYASADPTLRLQLLFYFAEVAESKVSQDSFGDFSPQRRVVQLAVTLPEPSSGNRTDLVGQDDGIHRIARRPRGQEDLERMR